MFSWLQHRLPATYHVITPDYFVLEPDPNQYGAMSLASSLQGAYQCIASHWYGGLGEEQPGASYGHSGVAITSICPLFLDRASSPDSPSSPSTLRHQEHPNRALTDLDA